MCTQYIIGIVVGIIAFIVICALIFGLIYKLRKQNLQKEEVLNLLDNPEPLVSFTDAFQLAKLLEHVTPFSVYFELLFHHCHNVYCVVCDIPKSCIVDGKTEKVVKSLEKEVILCRNTLLLLAMRILRCPMDDEQLCKLLAEVGKKLDIILGKEVEILPKVYIGSGKEKVVAANCESLLNMREVLQGIAKSCGSVVNGSVEQSNSELNVNSLKCVGDSSEVSK